VVGRTRVEQLKQTLGESKRAVVERKNLARERERVITALVLRLEKERKEKDIAGREADRRTAERLSQAS
jgi:hypothetical protein